MRPFDATTVNTILLVLLIPTIGTLWRVLWLSNQGLQKLNESFSEFSAALIGVKGQGGALQEIQSLRRQQNRLQAVVTVLLANSNVKLPDLGD